tara:strand:+ start:1581 stop:2243 length:663 start_codon:yes stop_codon:yes gene_type:complete
VIKIYDDFLDNDLYDRLGDTSMTFSQVQWIGRFAKPENAFHEFVKKLYLHAYPAMMDGNEIMGATAWWNIRPTNPKPHNDRVSYCTVDGVDYTPKDVPKQTFIYYLRAPDKGGRLNIYTKPPITDVKIGKEQFFSWADHQTDSIAPINNRLISFPFDVTHAVQSYEGNRVSIGVIFWNELPANYGKTDPSINASYDRPWEVKSNKAGTKELTEKALLGKS